MVIKVDIKSCGRLVDTQGTVSHSIAQKTVTCDIRQSQENDSQRK